MNALTSFFGQVLILAIIACGLLFLLSPAAGREVAKRGGFSLLMFVIAVMLAPGPAEPAASALVRLILAFVFAFAALLCLIQPKSASALVRGAALTLGTLLVLHIGFHYLWASVKGRVLAILAALGLAYIARKSRRE